MDDRRLRELVESYGTDPQRFPEAERDAAREALRSAKGARWLEDAKALDAALDELSPPALSDDEERAAIDRLTTAWLDASSERKADDANVVPIGRARARARRSRSQLPAHQRIAAGLLLAAAAGFGVWLGASQTAAEDGSDLRATATASAPSSDSVSADEPLDEGEALDLAAAAFGPNLAWNDDSELSY